MSDTKTLEISRDPPLDVPMYLGVMYVKHAAGSDRVSSSPQEATHVVLYLPGHSQEWTFRWPSERPWAEKLLAFCDRSNRAGRHQFRREFLQMLGAQEVSRR